METSINDIHDNPFLVYENNKTVDFFKSPLDNKQRVEQYIKRFPLKGVLFCDFDNQKGPQIVHSVPENIISNAEFRSISSRLFKKFKIEMNERMVTIVTNEHKIISCCIKNNVYGDAGQQEKYRNCYIFNFCLIVNKSDKSSPFVDLCKKVSKFLLQLEQQEDKFLSKSSEDTKRTNEEELKNITQKVFHSINKNGRIIYLYNNKYSNYQTLLASHIGPFHIKTFMPEIYDVPFIWPHNREECLRIIQSGDYDLPTSCLLNIEIDRVQQTYGRGMGAPCGHAFNNNGTKKYGIDNITHISKIADQTEMRQELVCQVIADLRFYELLTTVSIYQSTNRYRPTRSASELLKDDKIKNSIIAYSIYGPSHGQLSQAASSTLENFSILKLLREYHNDITIKEIKKLPHLHEEIKVINLQNFTQVCEAYGLLKRLYDYPILSNVLKGDIKMDCILCHFAEWWKDTNKLLDNQNQIHNSQAVLSSEADGGEKNAHTSREGAHESGRSLAANTIPMKNNSHKSNSQYSGNTSVGYNSHMTFGYQHGYSQGHGQGHCPYGYGPPGHGPSGHPLFGCPNSGQQQHIPQNGHYGQNPSSGYGQGANQPQSQTVTFYNRPFAPFPANKYNSEHYLQDAYRSVPSNSNNFGRSAASGLSGFSFRNLTDTSCNLNSRFKLNRDAKNLRKELIRLLELKFDEKVRFIYK